MANGIELVSSLIARYAIIENLYLTEDSPLVTDLIDAIVNLYAAILRYLVAAKSYYQKGTPSK